MIHFHPFNQYHGRAERGEGERPPHGIARPANVGPGQDARRERGAGGFSLFEALLATSILAFAVLAVTQAIAVGHGQTRTALHRERAVFLAETMMEEILSLPYADPEDASTSPGPEAGETGRPRFDNLDDYDGYEEDEGSLTDLSGDAYPAPYQSFTRSVAVDAETVDAGALGSCPGMRITITVQDEQGGTWPLVRYVPEPGS